MMAEAFAREVDAAPPAPAHAVGTALTLQTAAGLLLTMVAIQLVGDAFRC
jgi:hypothetical protein